MPFAEAKDTGLIQMASPLSDSPRTDISEPLMAADQSPDVPPLPVFERRSEDKRRYLVLFFLTVVTTTVAGAIHYYAFVAARGPEPQDWWSLQFLLNGLWYSIAVLTILGAHEMGHYLACRYYGVDASLPYFLPAPLLTGTLGAFIRIRQPIPTKRQLFDIGIAGPIAGFLVAVPVLFAGVRLSGIEPWPEDLTGRITEFGEPPLFRLAAWLTFGSLPEGQYLNLHPVGFAAWFGLLATALNLFPIGQLDGGHISYAVVGRRSTVITLGTVLCLIGLTFLSMSWVVWTTLTIGMLCAFGPHHPRTVDEHVPLDSVRVVFAILAILMFFLCFTPAPIETRVLVGGR